MGMTPIKTHKYSCDGCGKLMGIGDPGEDVLGLIGTVTEHRNDGGGSARWVACSRKCVATAVNTVLDNR